MISSKDITFICHIRIDSAARVKNIQTIYNFYKQTLPGCTFIFVEDNNTRAFNLQLDKNDTHVLMYNFDHIHKCRGYNYGASYAKTDVLIFLDVDVIIDSNKLLNCINNALQNTDSLCLIGYNGCAFYMTELGEKQFLSSLDIKDLYDGIKDIKLKTGESNKNALLGNTQAVGGCLIMTKSTFDEINGFNPFFIGWGYEDNEVVSRAHRLGFNVVKSNIADHFLYHLPHCSTSINKAKHNHYKQNEAIVNFVESLTKEQLQRYIKQW